MIKYILGFLSGILFKDLLIPIIIRKRQDVHYKKDKLLERVYSPLFSIVSDFTVNNIKVRSEDERDKYISKWARDIFSSKVKSNVLMIIALLCYRIPGIGWLKKSKQYIMNEIFFENFNIEDIITSYEISYSENACSKIIDLIKSHLSICDDKLLKLYKVLKDEYESTVDTANTLIALLYMFDKHPDIIKDKEEEEAKNLFKEKLKEEGGQNILNRAQKEEELRRIKENFIDKYKDSEEKIMLQIWLYVRYMFERLRGELNYSKDFYGLEN